MSSVHSQGSFKMQDTQGCNRLKLDHYLFRFESGSRSENDATTWNKYHNLRSCILCILLYTLLQQKKFVTWYLQSQQSLQAWAVRGLVDLNENAWVTVPERRKMAALK